MSESPDAERSDSPSLKPSSSLKPATSESLESILPKRERRANYQVDQMFRDAMKPSGGDPRKQKAPRPNTIPNLSDFQFYPKRLFELFDKEIYAYRKEIGFKAPKPEDLTEKEADQAQCDEQAKIDSAKPLTEDEMIEREELLSQGFDQWSRREFQQFLKANEKYGRTELDSIAQELETKTLSEIEEYSEVFWSRFKELSEHDKYLSQIERGEQRIQRRQTVKQALETKMRMYKAPIHQLRLNYGGSKYKHFTEEEDRFLLCNLYELGFENENVYDELRKVIRSSPQFRFDWFIRSRTCAEIQRRCNILISMVEKEIGDQFDARKAIGKSRGGARKQVASGTTNSISTDISPKKDPPEQQGPVKRKGAPTGVQSRAKRAK